MYDITMPKLSDSMEEGKIIAWKVKKGDAVKEGQVLAEVESDKATMELECFHDGTLAEILHGDGDEVSVGEVIGRIASEGEKSQPEAREPEPEKKVSKQPTDKQPEAGLAETKEAKKEAAKPAPRKEPEKKAAPETKPKREAGERISISPYARKLAEERGVDISTLKGSGPEGRIVARDVEESLGAPQAEMAEEKPPEKKEDARAGSNVDPQARVLAEKLGIDLSTVKGTGLNGRITADDVKSAKGETPAPQKAASIEELPALEATADEADIEDAPYRLKTQARRVTASKQVIPHFYVTRGMDVTALYSRKDEFKEKFGATITHLILLASLKALKENPAANRSYDRGKIFNWKGINLGLAVETDDGLTVAVIHNAQELDLKGIVKQSNELVEKARSGKLSSDDRRHPTFTVSSLGMFDIEQFDAIINPPSAMTLAVASALEAPVVRNGKLEVGRVMKLTLSCDHRIIDGVAAAKFMASLKANLENVEGLVR